MTAPLREPGHPSTPTTDDTRLVAGLRAGDEATFVELVERHHASMVRLALAYVPSRAVAEEVAQEAWLGVLKGIDRFESRSSLKTWIFRILTNIAKTRGERESRSVPFSVLLHDEVSGDEAAVEVERFSEGGAWSRPPKEWEISPEAHALSGELREAIAQAMATLPPVQREVMRLRDIEGWTAPEVCNVLALTETNQRVLLHRARSKVRRSLERYFDGGAV